jgi:hypothetical protein
LRSFTHARPSASFRMTGWEVFAASRETLTTEPQRAQRRTEH